MATPEFWVYVTRGALFKHFKGKHYVVLYRADDNQTVVYRQIENGEVYTRDVEEFVEEVYGDTPSKPVPRYDYVRMAPELLGHG